MRERISNKMMEKENFNVVDIFGENVFNDSVMQARLPKKVYKKLHEVMEEGKELDPAPDERPQMSLLMR